MFAQPDNAEAKELQARTFEQLAYGAENGTWRNFYLMGADELRNGVAGSAAALAPDFIANLKTEQLFDAIAIQIDGPQASGLRVITHWRFSDIDEEHTLTLKHGVLTHRRGAPSEAVDAAITMERTAFNEVIAGTATVDALIASGRLAIDGDAKQLEGMLSLLDPPDPNFAIVTP